jgi:hypothetical protein
MNKNELFTYRPSIFLSETHHASSFGLLGNDQMVCQLPLVIECGCELLEKIGDLKGYPDRNCCCCCCCCWYLHLLLLLLHFSLLLLADGQRDRGLDCL